jgi:hypothetical protein
MVCCLGEQWHLGRVYSVGRDYCETALEHGGVVVEVREVFNLADLRDCLPADLSPKMDSLELIIAAEHISFLPEAYIQSGPIDVKLDYASGEEKDKLEHYDPQKETSEVDKRIVACPFMHDGQLLSRAFFAPGSLRAGCNPTSFTLLRSTPMTQLLLLFEPLLLWRRATVFSSLPLLTIASV